MKWEDIFKKYDFNPAIKEKYEPVLKKNNQRHRLMQFILFVRSSVVQRTSKLNAVLNFSF